MISARTYIQHGSQMYDASILIHSFLAGGSVRLLGRPRRGGPKADCCEVDRANRHKEEK
jgi:hypothetical protein